ncbi:MAG: hypothetical protein CM15mP98_04740 [Paracoccaceae bacterium]|nr:MAG: hypothetical protein CM15mP98_04740 [Paracoccaceae bacterium]
MKKSLLQPKERRIITGCSFICSGSSSEDLDAAQVTEMYDLGEPQPGIFFAPAIGSGYFIAVRGSATEAIGVSSTASTKTEI